METKNQDFPKAGKALSCVPEGFNLEFKASLWYFDGLSVILDGIFLEQNRGLNGAKIAFQLSFGLAFSSAAGAERDEAPGRDLLRAEGEHLQGGRHFEKGDQRIKLVAKWGQNGRLVGVKIAEFALLPKAKTALSLVPGRI